MADRIEYDPNNPAMAKALELAEQLSYHCRMSNLPNDFVILGVAWNHFDITDKRIKEAYEQGKAFEKGRIAQLLGVV